MTDRQRLVGTWRLRTWTSTADDGTTIQPMGSQPEGILVYTAGGTMITTIGASGRPRITGGDILRGPSAEIVAMATSFIAYSGTWAVDGDDVVHRVEMSLFPDWIGTAQRRHVELSADAGHLTLRSDPMLVRGRTSTQCLEWERIRD